MSETEKRPILPVIVTDRVVDAKRSIREWELSKPLICWEVPPGFDDCDRPIYLVVDNIKHLAPLLPIGVALARRASIRSGDADFGLSEEAGRKAFEAEVKTSLAKKALLDAFVTGALPRELVTHLREVLETKNGHGQSISTSWTYAAPFNAPLAIPSLSPYESSIRNRYFGTDSKDSTLPATDRFRAKNWYEELVNTGNSRLFDRPRDDKLVKPLTEKFLNVLLPKMLPEMPRSVSVDLGEIALMSRARRRDIKNPKNSRHEQKSRSADSISFTSFLA